MQSWGDIVPLYNERGEFIPCVVVLFQPIYSNTGEVTGYILKPKATLDGSIKRQAIGKTFSVN